MKKSESLKELFSALAKFQGEINIIPFDKTVTVKLKSGGNYSYSYASFSSIKSLCSPLLSANGLAVSQLLGENKLTTILTHTSGEYIGDNMTLPVSQGMSPQDIGSVITYMKRYSYSAILGLASDEDTDGKITSKEKAPQKPVLDQMMSDWERAVEFMKKGGKIEAIKEKYELNESDENELRGYSKK